MINRSFRQRTVLPELIRKRPIILIALPDIYLVDLHPILVLFETKYSINHFYNQRALKCVHNYYSQDLYVRQR